jgi:hypothetical protein
MISWKMIKIYKFFATWLNHAVWDIHLKQTYLMPVWLTVKCMSALILPCHNSGSFSPQSVRFTTRFGVGKMAQAQELLQLPLLIIFPPQPHNHWQSSTSTHLQSAGSSAGYRLREFKFKTYYIKVAIKVSFSVVFVCQYTYR